MCSGCHFLRICAKCQALHDTWVPPLTNGFRLQVRNQELLAYKGGQDCLELGACVVWKGPRSRQNTPLSNSLAAACGCLPGKETWPHPDSPCQAASGASRALPVPTSPPLPTDLWLLPP